LRHVFGPSRGIVVRIRSSDDAVAKTVLKHNKSLHLPLLNHVLDSLYYHERGTGELLPEAARYGDVEGVCVRISYNLDANDSCHLFYSINDVRETDRRKEKYTVWDSEPNWEFAMDGKAKLICAHMVARDVSEINFRESPNDDH